ncbi:hypothetical protein [Micromonospora sp. NPDC005211]|uniref:hypothetical protein n=1 Tax=Micromonospora sp. NPDC005211 TaxID=3157023 RepID=UPI0033A1B938
MTAKSNSDATTPDLGPLSFKLWFPQWETVQGNLHCRFYVTTAGLTQLHEGSADCMTHFLADLAHPDTQVTDWCVNRHRTTYFSDYPHAANWQDRLTLTWAVEVQTDLKADPEDAGTHSPGPHGSYAYDITFKDEDDAWERTRERVLVIAGTPYGTQIDEASLNLGQTLRALSIPAFQGMTVLDLGELDLPEDLPQVDHVLDQCSERGLCTNWKNPVPPWDR